VLTEGDCPSWSPDGKKIACCVKSPDRPPQILVYDLGTARDVTLGIGWYRANWMPDSKTLVANGIVGQTVGMVRLPLAAPGKPVVLATEFENPFSPSCSQDIKQIVFIAKRQKRVDR
jgi:Tol biopolymer transport system component